MGWDAPPFSMSSTFFLRNLARAFLAGDWSSEGLLERGREACGGAAPRLRPVVRRVLAAFPEGNDEEALVRFLAESPQVRDLAARLQGSEVPRRLFWGTPRMGSAEAIPAGELPVLRTAAEVAAWLRLDLTDLDWFAAPSWRVRNSSGPGHHYHYQWLRKRSGQSRLLEMPKRRLKALQRVILHELLDKVPPHDAAHGYRRGRSILTGAVPHVGRTIVVRFDLRDFFPSIHAGRIHALFHVLGYPREVARILTRLCTHETPASVWESAPDGTPDAACRARLEQRHLPQGAPTSPALANLCTYRLDCRLAGLAHALGAAYTRYADDLTLSGGSGLAQNSRRLHVLVCRIALEEGFEVNPRKTRFQRQGVRQQVAGVVVNARPNVRRADYDRLKATLHNCLRHGPASQNREKHQDFRRHLLGKIAHLAHLHSEHGKKVRSLFDRIQWPEPEQPS